MCQDPSGSLDPTFSIERLIDERLWVFRVGSRVSRQQRLGLTYLFITHDLSVVRQIAHHVVVMKSGKVLEEGTVDQLFLAPAADYPKELLGAIPCAAFAK